MSKIFGISGCIVLLHSVTHFFPQFMRYIKKNLLGDLLLLRSKAEVINESY